MFARHTLDGNHEPASRLPPDDVIPGHHRGAEQFLTILRLFNVPVTHFAPQRKRDTELQNALARLGAGHLQESDDALPSELLEEVGNVVWEALVTADSPRHLTALAPVLVRNVDRVSLEKLRVRFREAGIERRLGWLIENILVALRQELASDLPRKWVQKYQRAELVLGALTTLEQPDRGDRITPDLLDADILSKKTLEEVTASRSKISRRWGIATSIAPEDFVEALRASRGAR
ncbi:MAG: hypothetical protein ABMA01_07555 [Chthoniobacteraceae bacterium]